MACSVLNKIGMHTFLCDITAYLMCFGANLLETQTYLCRQIGTAGGLPMRDHTCTHSQQENRKLFLLVFL